MTQRRLPSGQGPSRRGGRQPAPGPRGAGGRGAIRRAIEHGTRSHGLNPRESAGREPQAREPVAGQRPRPRLGEGADHRAGPRGVSRPGIRRAAGPARRTKAPRKPRRISGRAAVLGLLLFVMALAYAYPVRVYLAQQAEINRMRSAQADQRHRIQDLTDQIAKWRDDEFVIVQARVRFQLVRKGELLYMVSDPAATGTGEADPASPWYHSLWSNIQAADNPGAP